MSIWPVLRVDEVLKATAAALCAAGLLLVAEGTWIQMKAGLAQWLIEAAWRRERASSQVAAPWPWADTRPIAKLIWGAGNQATTLIILEGSSGRNLAFGPVHDASSVAPGKTGNSVIEGHRDTHFKILRGAKPGDQITIEALDGSKSNFTIIDARIVDSRSARISLNADTPRLTLVTCYPFDAISPGGPLRWLVSAEAVSAKSRLRDAAIPTGDSAG